MIVIGLCGKPPNERYQGGSREVQGGRGSLPCDEDNDDDDEMMMQLYKIKNMSMLMIFLLDTGGSG